MAPTKKEKKSKVADKINEPKEEKETTEKKADKPAKTLVKQAGNDFTHLNFKLLGRILAFLCIVFLTFATRLYNLSVPRLIW